ncbi:uncharacterized protein C8R40DRAFT_1167090 [Lentinula edodes]|uniref:uncharacterized protein n=1 Tax=Lentinula edodes TaxID=5353 RepID=UPI001E8E35A6|nr:uncharacterized protein C8R40DRAFT_1167090 [Lentinula edodes]KAH7879127.1 hypothetical protein C8R40DRAFT_1167090 [Lentinula edodes]
MDIAGIVTVYIARMTLPYALLILEDLSSITPYHSWIDSDQESHETLTKIEASYLLRIAEAQKTLFTTEKSVLEHKILVTKLILELHLHRVKKIHSEDSKASQTIVKMKHILEDIENKDLSLPSMEPDNDISEDFEEDLDELDTDEERPEPEPESNDFDKDTHTKITYYEDGKEPIPIRFWFIFVSPSLLCIQRTSKRTNKGTGGHATQMLQAADKISLAQTSSTRLPNAIFPEDASPNPMAPPASKSKKPRTKASKKKEVPAVSASPMSGYPAPPIQTARRVPKPSIASIQEVVLRDEPDADRVTFFKGWTPQELNHFNPQESNRLSLSQESLAPSQESNHLMPPRESNHLASLQGGLAAPLTYPAHGLPVPPQESNCLTPLRGGLASSLPYSVHGSEGFERGNFDREGYRGGFTPSTINSGTGDNMGYGGHSERSYGGGKGDDFEGRGAYGGNRADTYGDYHYDESTRVGGNYQRDRDIRGGEANIAKNKIGICSWNGFTYDGNAGATWDRGMENGNMASMGSGKLEGHRRYQSSLIHGKIEGPPQYARVVPQEQERIAQSQDSLAERKMQQEYDQDLLPTRKHAPKPPDSEALKAERAEFEHDPEANEDEEDDSPNYTKDLPITSRQCYASVVPAAGWNSQKGPLNISTGPSRSVSQSSQLFSQSVSQSSAQSHLQSASQSHLQSALQSYPVSRSASHPISLLPTRPASPDLVGNFSTNISSETPADLSSNAKGSRNKGKKPASTDPTKLSFYPAQVRKVISVAQSNMHRAMVLEAPFLTMENHEKLISDCLESAIKDRGDKGLLVEDGEYFKDLTRSSSTF